jgi:hypothetical protein
MKTTFQITKEQIEHLKTSVDIMFGKTIINTQDAQQLSKAISQKTKQPINYNTLRRIYNIVPTNSKPSVFSIDILAQYVGFSGCYDFFNQLEANQKNVLLDVILHFKTVKRIDFELVKTLDAKFGNTVEFHTCLQSLISLANELKDYDFFARIFTLKQVFNLCLHFNTVDLHYRYTLHLYYTIHHIAQCVRHSKPLQKVALKHYCKLPYRDNYYIELFVDLDHINGYYGLLLDEYSKHKKDSQAVLFYNCMKFYGYWFTNDKAGMIKHIKKINTITTYKNIYTIPIARQRVCQAIYTDCVLKQPDPHLHETIRKDILYLMKHYNSIDYFVDYIGFLVQGLIYSKNYRIIILVTEEFVQFKALQSSHIQQTGVTYMLLYYAIALYHTNQKQKAKTYFKQVNLMNTKICQYSTTLKAYKAYEKLMS